MKENEIKVMFEIEKEILDNFLIEASKRAERSGLGIKLTKKQSFYLGLKEITEIWKNERKKELDGN